MLARLLLLLLCVVGIADAQTPLPPANAPLPIDPAVRTGTLANGLRWFIRTNARPEKRAELRLVVNAGSVLEDDDQRGLAHFLEHMAFNGTRRFAKNDIVKYLESIGVRFGADLNAYTGFDETVYILPVPTDSAGLLSRSFDILEDWASTVLMDSAEVIAERGVVFEEWRSGRGAQSRILDTHFPVLFRGSRYAERLPIGDTAIIRGATPAPLRRFYRDWYRPNNMAVVAVGDFNADSVQAMIASRFGALVNPPSPRAREPFAVPSHTDTRVSIASDRELTVSSLEVLWQLPRRTTRTVGDWRQRLVEDIYNAAFNRRLSELTQRPNAAWVGAASGIDAYTRASAAYGLRFAAEDGKIEPALEAIVVEARRVDAHGFLASEIARVKTDLLRSYERSYAERDKSESGGFAEAYVGHFLDEAPIPGIGFYFEHAPAAIASITLDEVNAVGRRWISDSNRVIMASLTEREGVTQPTRASLLAALDRAAAAPIAPWTETLAEGALVSTPPTPGRVIARGRIDELDITEWTLGNGVRVLLKSTDFKADEVLVSGFAPGGASLYPDARATAAELATTLIERGGVGTLSVIDLQKSLSGKVAAIGTALGERSQDVSGRASPKDLETLFELLWLRFTAPRVDSAAVQAFRQQIGAVLANRSRAPEAAFSDTITLTLANYHPRVQLPTAEMFNSVSLDDALAIYRERFGDASGFTFVFVGNVTAEQLEPLLVRWIAALPTTGRTEQPRDLGIRPPPGTVQKVVRAGVEPKSSTVVLYHGERSTTIASRQAFRTFGDILESRLLEELRETLGGTYSVSVSASTSTQPRDVQQLAIQFGSSPENADTLFAAVQRTIEALRTVGPTETELASAIEKQRRQQEVSVRENGYWLSGVLSRLRLGTDPRQMLDAPQIMAATTAEAVREAARTLVDPAQFVRVVQQPAAP
jgi:zinc protease